MKLLGRVKNAVKSTALPDLLDAVEVRGHESWWGTLMNQFSCNLINLHMATQQL